MPSYAISPLRFTTNLTEMADFLVILGINKVLERKNRYILFATHSGYVALHHCSGSTLPGKTQFELVTPNIETATSDLTAKGITPLSWDEAYTKYIAIQNPLDHWIWISETQTDTYGYQKFLSNNHHNHKLTVTAVYFSKDFSKDQQFFNHFNFQALTPGDNHWQELTSTNSKNHGTIGLHGIEGADLTPDNLSPLHLSCEPTSNPVMSTYLSFNTTEPIEKLANRIIQAGHNTNIMSEHGITNLVTVDPDGVRLEIHPIA